MLPRVVTPDTGIQHTEQNCRININSDDRGSGTLYISEERLIWENQEHRGLSLGYKDIAIHAVSKDLQAFPEECLYVMFNGEICEPVVNGNGQTEEYDCADNEFAADTSGTISEIRFIPVCKDNLKRMFDAMSDCQCLHPDSEDSDDYYGGDGDSEEQNYEGAMYPPTVYNGGAGEGFYTSEEGLQHLTPAGQATLARLENMLADSQISEPEGISQMEGVQIEEEGPMNTDEPPVVGRPPVVDDNPQQGAPILPSVEGQFDDAEDTH
ncbi:methylosome subunit pICln-like [Styela clava]